MVLPAAGWRLVGCAGKGIESMMQPSFQHNHRLFGCSAREDRSDAIDVRVEVSGRRRVYVQNDHPEGVGLVFC